jgi:hypothetical protein
LKPLALPLLQRLVQRFALRPLRRPLARRFLLLPLVLPLQRPLAELLLAAPLQLEQQLVPVQHHMGSMMTGDNEQTIKISIISSNADVTMSRARYQTATLLLEYTARFKLQR